ncbi:hypothetical protein BDZ97DRAFT_1788539, partial [Flammula alnicola]
TDSNHILPSINEVLPDDILAEILTHSVVCSHSYSKVEQTGERCTPSPEDRSKVTSIHHHCCISTPDPLLLSQVCSRWRGLILHTPRLWDSIAIISYPGAHQLQLLQLWLARSGQLPISIFFLHHRCAEVRSGFLQSFRSLFQLLSSHAARWRAIDLSIYKYEGADTLARIGEFITPNSLKSLESVSVNITGRDPPFVDDFARILFQSSSLHALKWGSASIYHRVPPPWFQLRSIELFDFSLHTLTAISACKQLEELHIINGRIHEMGTNNACITLPNLQVLRLTSTWMTTSPSFPITVPSLRALFLMHVVDLLEPHSTWDAVKEMLLRSACSLEKFSFIDKSIRFSEEHLSSQVFSSLTELTLASLMLLDRVISRLSMVSGDNNTEDSHCSILPNLEILELRGCRMKDGVISKMVSSRCQNKQASLSRIQVRTNADRSSHVQDVDVLATLAREGLQVDLGHNYRFHV